MCIHISPYLLPVASPSHPPYPTPLGGHKARSWCPVLCGCFLLAICFNVGVLYQTLAWQLSSKWWLRYPGSFYFGMMLLVWQGQGIIWGRFFWWKWSTWIPRHSISCISVASSFLDEQGTEKCCLPMCPEEKWKLGHYFSEGCKHFCRS